MKPRQYLSVLFTLIVYTIVFNWKVSLMVTLGIAWHEYSHMLAARRVGLSTGGFWMLPFLGGVAFMGGNYKSRADNVFVSIMGPIGGSLLALLSAVLWLITGINNFAAVAFWLLLFNAFNLLPISFMDGGQILNSISQSISRSVGMASLVLSTVIGFFILWFINPIMAVIVGLFGAASSYKELRDWDNFRSDNPFKRNLVSEEYLNPPEPMDKRQLATAISAYLMAIVLMGGLLYNLNKVDGTSFKSLLGH